MKATHAFVVSMALVACHGSMTVGRAQQARAPIVVVETTNGTFEFETYPNDAPKSVAHIVDLVKRGFYDGQRVHRAIPGFVIQWGDPQSRDMATQAGWGRGEAASSGKPIGVAEFAKRRVHAKGAVGLAHAGNPALADSQIYVTLADRPELNGKYVVVGRVVSGADVPERIRRGDVITRVYVKE